MRKIRLKYLKALVIISVLWIQALTAQTPGSGTDSPAALETAALKGGKSVAVGTFVNKSDNRAFDYLETILPNALASSLDSKYSIKTIKPRSIADIFKKNQLEKDFDDAALYTLSSDIKADFFVFGTFEPQSGNRIKTEIKIYKVSSSSLFTFTDIGFLEVEIFRLIDRLSLNIKNITDPSMYYKSENIQKNSRLAVITNIDGEDLNKLYYEILTRGHKLNLFQGASVTNIVDKEGIDKFYHISSGSASYRRIYDRKSISLLYGTWAGNDYYKDILNQRNIHRKYTFDFTESGKKAYTSMGKIGPGGIDYLMIIGFNENRSEAWIRCINLKTGNLIFTQSGISGSSVDEITRQMLLNISEAG
jgi:hypothetical protein